MVKEHASLAMCAVNNPLAKVDLPKCRINKIVISSVLFSTVLLLLD